MARKRSSTSQRAVRTVVQKLESLHAAGVTHLPKPPPAPASPPTAAGGSVDAAKPSPAEASPQPAPAEDRAAALAKLARRVAACTRCAELARTRTQTVFGTGNPHARLMFIGEAPGADEDRQGEPFVGAAGQLLTDIIVKGMKLRREDVYICNVLRCRPPGNRTPTPQEAANCREYLDGQIAIVRPEFICCLGAVAAQNLLGSTESIGRLRGRVQEYQGIRVICTYHPSYLLRTPSAKRDTWEDIQQLMSLMGLEGPKK